MTISSGMGSLALSAFHVQLGLTFGKLLDSKLRVSSGPEAHLTLVMEKSTA
jgi:hypothetical protein